MQLYRGNPLPNSRCNKHPAGIGRYTIYTTRPAVVWARLILPGSLGQGVATSQAHLALRSVALRPTMKCSPQIAYLKEKQICRRTFP